MLIETSEVLCYAAKWYQEDEVFFDSIQNKSKKSMLKGVHKLVSEADAIVHYNGTSFDMPVLNTSFIECGFKPPAPYKNIDLLRVVRSQFKFTSNKMVHVAEKLGVGKKHDTTFDLWVGCINNDPVAWEAMREYNIQDVTILEGMYEKLKPWIKNHPNVGLYEGSTVCPNCGSGHYQARGTAISSSGSYQRYQCTDCGAWFRSKHMDKQDVETFRKI